MAKQSRVVQVKETRRRASKAWRKSPAVVFVTARWAAKFTRSRREPGN